MSEPGGLAGQVGQAVSRPWRRPMMPRDPAERHRAATPLELFFDLCFVVAIAQNGLRLEHALAEDHIGDGVLSYLLVFFAIWWAWMNFTWFASAYDNDDVPYRIATLVVMAGVLVLAAGVPRAFDDRDFAVVFTGYLIMRIGLIAQQLRAARAHPEGRSTMRRYAAGEAGCMVLWAVAVFAVPEDIRLPVWLLAAACELLVPPWAERTGHISWHPRHIAERYGLFTIIVLGETILSATNAVRSGLEESSAGDFALVAAGGLLTVFALWWVYFSMDATRLLNARTAFRWGYGHFVIFASGAAVGAGISVNIALKEHHAELSQTAAGLAVGIPVFCYLLVVWLLMVRPHGADAPYSWAMPVMGVLAVAACVTPEPILVSGLFMAVLLGLSVLAHARKRPA